MWYEAEGSFAGSKAVASTDAGPRAIQVLSEWHAHGANPGRTEVETARARGTADERMSLAGLAGLAE